MISLKKKFSYLWAHELLPKRFNLIVLRNILSFRPFCREEKDGYHLVQGLVNMVDGGRREQQKFNISPAWFLQNVALRYFLLWLIILNMYNFKKRNNNIFFLLKIIKILMSTSFVPGMRFFKKKLLLLDEFFELIYSHTYGDISCKPRI